MGLHLSTYGNSKNAEKKWLVPTRRRTILSSNFPAFGTNFYTAGRMQPAPSVAAYQQPGVVKVSAKKEAFVLRPAAALYRITPQRQLRCLFFTPLLVLCRALCVGSTSSRMCGMIVSKRPALTPAIRAVTAQKSRLDTNGDDSLLLPQH